MQGLAGVQGGKRADEPNPQPFGLARGFFTQPLFDAAVPASRRRGDVEVLLAQQRLNVAIVEQLHATRIAFYTALFNDSLRELGEAQRQRLAENVSTQAERYQAGQIGSRSDGRARDCSNRNSIRASRKCAAAIKALCSPWRHLWEMIVGPTADIAQAGRRVGVRQRELRSAA